MPFESKEDTKINVGRTQIRTAASKKKGVLGLTNKEKVALAKTGTKNLLEGTQAKNRKKKNRYLEWDE